VDLNLYIQANGAFVELLKQAQACKNLFAKSGVAIPLPLEAFIGSGESKAKGADDSPRARKIIHIVPPRRPRRFKTPVEAGVKWISVLAKDAVLSSLILAILRRDQLLSLADVLKEVRRYQLKTIPNSTYNAVKRLQDSGLIYPKDDGRLALFGPDGAPMLEGDYLWGDPDHLASADIAAFRREVVLQMIADNPGIQAAQMVAQLIAVEWFPPKFNKDTIKGDLLALQTERKIRKSGSGRGWEAEKEKEAPKAPPS
jgi:hypothetical protein